MGNWWHVIDLNADVGEGVSDDAALLDVVTSANVACGAHAGDDATMAAVCRLAVVREIAIGAHVSYEDREGFGRVDQKIEPDELAATVTEQILRLAAHARGAGGDVSYVKPHGALYNRIVRDAEQAGAVVAGLVAATAELEAPLALLGLPGSEVLVAGAAAGLFSVPEAFADRAYTPIGTLVPRSEEGAVIHDAEQVVERSVRIATGADIEASDGSRIIVNARSLCVHGDTPGAASLARSIRDAILDAGVEIVPFAGRF